MLSSRTTLIVAEEQQLEKKVFSSSTNSSPFNSSPKSSPNPKSMEEVWNHINLASLHETTHSYNNPLRVHHRPPPSTASQNHRTTSTNFILQDFLAGPLINPSNGITGVVSPPPEPAPVTVLSLNSRPGFDFLDGFSGDPLMMRSGNNNNNDASYLQNCPNISNLTSPFEAFASSSSSGLGLFGRMKRVDQECENGSGRGDKRHKRMIKNRESAARSRARKQAYTNELELEVQHLMEENARLKRQQEQLCQAAAAQQPKNRPLHRTSTAPF